MPSSGRQRRKGKKGKKEKKKDGKKQCLAVVADREKGEVLYSPRRRLPPPLLQSRKKGEIREYDGSNNKQ